MTDDYTAKGCALRGRVHNNGKENITQQRLEINDEIANCITSVTKDSLVLITYGE